MNNIQEKFIKSYDKSIKNSKNQIADFQETIKTLVYLYLIAEKKSDKEQLAYDIYIWQRTINIVGLNKLLNMKKLYLYASKRKEQIQKSAKANQLRRHQKRNNFSLTDEEWKYAVEYFDYRCAYCGTESNLEYEHFVPFSKGGSFTKENILPVCKRCNSSKCDKEFKEWYPKQNFYSKDRERKIYNYFKTVKMF